MLGVLYYTLISGFRISWQIKDERVQGNFGEDTSARYVSSKERQASAERRKLRRQHEISDGLNLAGLAFEMMSKSFGF